MKTFTFPGRMGDILMSWPIAYQWYQLTKEKFRIITCEHWNCPRVLDLLKTQECVAEAEIVYNQIISDHCGGQPWHFNMPNNIDVFHMGYPSRPTEQLTLFTLKHFPIDLNEDKVLNEPSLFIGEREPKNYCVFFAKPYQNWETALLIMQHITGFFDKVYVIGLPEDLIEIRKNVPDIYWNKWDNINRKSPDLLEDAKLIRDARMVLSINSLVPTISNILKVPTIVVHRAQPFQVYSNTGSGQFNYYPSHKFDIEPALNFLQNV